MYRKPLTTAMVKELRDRTGATMMDCKRALQDADGDMEAAAQILNAERNPGSGDNKI